MFDYKHFDFSLSEKTLTVASPLIVQFIFSIGGWLIFFIFIEQLGGESLAASQVLRNIFGIVGVGTWALATTCNTMVSNIIGQRRQREVISIIVKICKLSLAYAVVVCVLLLAFSREFLSIYSDDLSLIAFSIPSLRVIVVATLIMSVSTVIFNGVVGTGNTLVNLTMEVSSVCIYLLYCYFIIRVRQSPLYLCWGSELFTGLVCSSFQPFTCEAGGGKGKRFSF